MKHHGSLRPLLSTAEVAQLLQKSVRTVRRRVQAGVLVPILEGGEYRFDPKDVEEYLRRQRGLRTTRKK